VGPDLRRIRDRRCPGWDSEACPDATTCTVEGDSDVDLVALFDPKVVLDVIIDDGVFIDDVSTEQGVSSDADISVAVDVGDTTPLALLDIEADETCEDRCTYGLPVGTTVTLTATATDPWYFSRWIEQYTDWERDEGCNDSEDGSERECSLTLLGDATITVIFENRDEFDRADGFEELGALRIADPGRREPTGAVVTALSRAPPRPRLRRRWRSQPAGCRRCVRWRRAWCTPSRRRGRPLPARTAGCRRAGPRWSGRT
jgi:hypothetical protein